MFRGSRAQKVWQIQTPANKAEFCCRCRCNLGNISLHFSTLETSLYSRAPCFCRAVHFPELENCRTFRGISGSLENMRRPYKFRPRTNFGMHSGTDYLKKKADEIIRNLTVPKQIQVDLVIASEHFRLLSKHSRWFDKKPCDCWNQCFGVFAIQSLMLSFLQFMACLTERNPSG